MSEDFGVVAIARMDVMINLLAQSGPMGGRRGGHVRIWAGEIVYGANREAPVNSRESLPG